MTLDEAYSITEKMTIRDHYKPTDEMRQAKELIYREVIKPEYGDNPMMEPDFNEGWR